MSNYKHKAHVKYSLKVHIILVTKYRKKLFLKDYFKNDIEQFLYDVSKQAKFQKVQFAITLRTKANAL